MAHTYTQLYIQIVFAVYRRRRLIRPEFRDKLEKYITGIIKNKGHKLIAISCMPDHAHVFVGMKPHTALSDLVRDIKNNSTNHINRQGWVKGRFRWQAGFGAFSYGHSQISRVARYIENQDAHHQRVAYEAEFRRFVETYEIEHHPKYLFPRRG